MALRLWNGEESEAAGGAFPRATIFSLPCPCFWLGREGQEEEEVASAKAWGKAGQLRGVGMTGAPTGRAGRCVPCRPVRERPPCAGLRPGEVVAFEV